MRATHFKLLVSCASDDFADDLDVTLAAVLRRCAERIEGIGYEPTTIRDSNGNAIGAMHLLDVEV